MPRSRRKLEGCSHSFHGHVAPATIEWSPQPERGLSRAMPCSSVVLIACLLAPAGEEGDGEPLDCGFFAPWLDTGRVRSTWDFLGPLGSIEEGDDFTIVDVKFLMHTQWHRTRGASFGLLPYPI